MSTIAKHRSERRCFHNNLPLSRHLVFQVKECLKTLVQEGSLRFFVKGFKVYWWKTERKRLLRTRYSRIQVRVSKILERDPDPNYVTALVSAFCWYPGPVWTCMDLPGPAWTCLDLPGPAWTCLDLPGLAWTWPGIINQAPLLWKWFNFKIVLGQGAYSMKSYCRVARPESTSPGCI